MDEAVNPTPRTAVSLSEVPRRWWTRIPRTGRCATRRRCTSNRASAAWIVTRYDLVREALRDTATYSSEFGDFLARAQKIAFRSAPAEVQQKLIALNRRMIPLPPTMLTLDEPRHTQYRSLVSQLFTGSQVRRGESTVRRVIDAGIARLAAASRADGHATADFVAAFALPVPLEIIADRLGIPGEDREFFNEGAAAAADALRLTPLAPEQMVHRAQLAVDLQQLLVSLVDARRETPADDMIGILANATLEEEGRPPHPRRDPEYPEPVPGRRSRDHHQRLRLGHADPVQEPGAAGRHTRRHRAYPHVRRGGAATGGARAGSCLAW